MILSGVKINLKKQHTVNKANDFKQGGEANNQFYG